MTFGVSDRFRAAYEESHLSVVEGGVYAPDGTLITTLEFDRGAQNSVSIDVTAANRRSCSIAVVPDDVLLPITPTSPLAPVNEIRLSRGIQFDDGTSELVPLGIFGIQSSVEVASPAGPTIAIAGIDRSKRLDVNLTRGLSFAAGTGFDTVFTSLANASGVTYDTFFDPDVAATTTPALVFHAGDNIWQNIQTAASSLGCWAYFDELGVFTVIPVPDLDEQLSPSWTYARGAQAMFDETARTLALEDGSQKAYSHAVVESQVHGTGTPLRSDAYDDDPASPTYYLGPFGDRPIFDGDVSAFITTQAQCDRAAAALLRRNYGLLERVTMRAAPNPALTGGDVVSITDPETDTDAAYLSESWTLSLFAVGGPSTITFRSRQLH